MKKLYVLLFGVSLVSCATPEAVPVPVETPPKVAPKEEQPVEEKVVEPEVTAPIAFDDGLRMPDMLELPSEERLRSSAADTEDAATVIARPPSE